MVHILYSKRDFILQNEQYMEYNYGITVYVLYQ